MGGRRQKWKAQGEVGEKRKKNGLELSGKGVQEISGDREEGIPGAREGGVKRIGRRSRGLKSEVSTG